MQFAADLALQGRINKLVLTHARHAAEGLVDDARLVVVAVAGQILDGDLGVRKGCTQFSFELASDGSSSSHDKWTGNPKCALKGLISEDIARPGPAQEGQPAGDDDPVEDHAGPQ